jgi:hypothetical protein
VVFEPGQAIIAVLYAEPALTVDEIVERLNGQLDQAVVEDELGKMRSQGLAAEDFDQRWSLAPQVGG